MSLSATPWTVARQAPLSVGSPGKSPGMDCLSFSMDLPDAGIEHMSPALAGGFFTTESPGELVI